MRTSKIVSAFVILFMTNIVALVFAISASQKVHSQSTSGLSKNYLAQCRHDQRLLSISNSNVAISYLEVKSQRRLYIRLSHDRRRKTFLRSARGLGRFSDLRQWTPRTNCKLAQTDPSYRFPRPLSMTRKSAIRLVCNRPLLTSPYNLLLIGAQANFCQHKKVN